MKILSKIFCRGTLSYNGGCEYCSSRKSANNRLSYKNVSSKIIAGTRPCGKMFKYQSGLSNKLMKTVSYLCGHSIFIFKKIKMSRKMSSHLTPLAFNTKWALCAYGQKRIEYKRNEPGTFGGSTEPEKYKFDNSEQ